MPRNAVLLPPLLTEDAILHMESDTGNILKIFDRFITEWAKERVTASGEDNDNNKDSKVSVESEEEKTTKTRPPLRRYPPSQTIATTSWPSSMTSQSSLHESSRIHSPSTRTSVPAYGSVVG